MISPAHVLTSRIGRRMFTTFAIFALLPMMVFAWLALRQASEQLREAAEQELHQNAKNAGMTLASMLVGMDADLKLARAVLLDQTSDLGIDSKVLGDQLRIRFDALYIWRDGQVDVVFGTPRAAVTGLDDDQRGHLAADDCLMVVRALPSTGPAVTLLRRLDDGALVAAEAENSYLFDAEDLRAGGAQVLVFSSDTEFLFGSVEPPEDMTPLRTALRRRPSSGTFEWQLRGDQHIGHYWRLFLHPQLGDDLLLVQSSASSRVLAPLYGFQWLLSWMAAAVLFLVTMTGLVQIRRVLAPIAELRQATHRVAGGDMSQLVRERGNDELAELAHSFNLMTGQLRENIARREASERELIGARDTALAAVRAKAELLTNVSHELRTPLTSILVYSELIRSFDPGDKEQMQEFLDVIEEQANHLHLLVERVLDLSSGGQWEMHPIEPQATVSAAIELLPDASRRRIALSQAPKRPRIVGSHDRLVPLWFHLLDNALKFSPESAPVEIVITVHDAEIEVAVTDHGCGIAAEDQQRVFDAFCQVGRDQLTEKSPGVGLGLTLARNIVDHHGGRIELESTPGRGSTFRVRLPLMQEPAPSTSADARQVHA